MILMWLGSFVLTLWGLMESRKYLSSVLAPWQSRLYHSGLDVGFSPMLQRTLGLVALEASPQKSIYSGLALYNMRILGLRPAVLMMSLSSLGAWWVLLLGVLFLNFSGLVLLGVAFLMFLTTRGPSVLQNGLRCLGMVGVFLLGGEMMLRQAGVLPSLLGESSLAFFLADGRLLAVSFLFLASLVLSLFIEEDFWTVPLVLSLVVSNTISFNGALTVLAGERVARVLLLAYRSRALNQDCRRVGRQFAMASILGVLVGLFVAGELRTLSNLGFGGMAAIQEKLFFLMFLFAVMLFCQCVAQMLWGHFAAQVKVEDLQEPKYFGSQWHQAQLLSDSALRWAKNKIHQRLHEIKYHLQGLETVANGQIPETIRARLKTEEEQLSKLENDVLKSLG